MFFNLDLPALALNLHVPAIRIDHPNPLIAQAEAMRGALVHGFVHDQPRRVGRANDLARLFGGVAAPLVRRPVPGDQMMTAGAQAANAPGRADEPGAAAAAIPENNALPPLYRVIDEVQLRFRAR